MLEWKRGEGGQGVGAWWLIGGGKILNLNYAKIVQKLKPMLTNLHNIEVMETCNSGCIYDGQD